VCAFGVWLAAAAFTAGQQPAFDVASLKPNTSGDPYASMGVQPGGRFLARNMPVKDLVSFAYNVQSYQVVGGPGWMTSNRFDINAVAPDGTSIAPATPGGPPSVMQLALRALLADRLGLLVHTESRELPVYKLMLAHGDGTLGGKIRHSSADCSAPPGVGRQSSPQPESQRPTCGMRFGPGVIAAGGRSMAQLAGTLSQFVQRPVTNETGLDGLFDFDLTWAYEPTSESTPAARVAPVDPDAPTLFTAVQEQLGLKLQAARGPVDVVVIDKVSPPAPD
jgi:uncharacterized protein (TIGR03435 family)